MEQILAYFSNGLLSMTWQQFVMFGIGGLLIWLAVAKDYEPMLLLPIGFGAILVNLPLAVVLGSEGHPGPLQILFDAGIMTELFPLLIFIGVGAMIDFRPLLQRPWLLIFGLGLSMVLEWGIILWGIIVGLLGIAIIIIAYPVYVIILKNLKCKYSEEIIKLSDDLLTTNDK